MPWSIPHTVLAARPYRLSAGRSCGEPARGVAFLDTRELHDGIEYVVDRNPGEHGKHVPVTGRRVVSPDFLPRYQSDVLIVMNAVYAAEITNTLRILGVRTTVVTAWRDSPA